MRDYQLGLYEKSMPDNLSIKNKLIEVKISGFDFIEISIDESDEKQSRLRWNREERLDVIKAIYSTGVRINTMCLSGHRKYPIGSENEHIRNTGMEIMSAAIVLAADLGIRIIQIAGYDEYYRPSTENTAKYFTENLKRSTALAARYGVILAFETMETEFMNTVSKAMHYVNKTDSPYLQVYPDLGNITNAAVQYGHRVTDDLESGKGHIAAMHLKETVPGKFREIPFGKGHVNFGEGIKAVAKQGVNLYVGEFWFTGNEDWRKQLCEANEFLRDKLDVNFRKG